jgi:hypothetical protein
MNDNIVTNITGEVKWIVVAYKLFSFREFWFESLKHLLYLP